MIDGIDDQIESLQHELTDERLTLWRSYEAVGIHLSIAQREGKKTGAGKLDFFFIGKRDDDVPINGQSERLDDVLRQERHDASCVNKGVDVDATNPIAVQMAGLSEYTVTLVLENDPRADFSHRRLA